MPTLDQECDAIVADMIALGAAFTLAGESAWTWEPRPPDMRDAIRARWKAVESTRPWRAGGDGSGDPPNQVRGGAMTDLFEITSRAVTFDYVGLAPDAVRAVERARDRIRISHRNAIIESGLLLLEVKAALGHGNFTSWCEAELGFSATTARNYMRAAETFGDKPATVAVMAPGALYAAASAPDEVRADIVRRVEGGEILDRRQVGEMIDAHAEGAKEKRQIEIKRRRRKGLTEEEIRRLDRREARERREDEARRDQGRNVASEAIDRLHDHWPIEDISEIAGLIDRAGYHFFELVAERFKARVN